MVAQFTAKITNSERKISTFCHLACSINKPKSQILFTCKNIYLEKKIATGKGGGDWRQTDLDTLQCLQDFDIMSSHIVSNTYITYSK